MASTRAFNLPTRAFSLLTRGFKLVTREFEFLTRTYELVTRAFELVTRFLFFHNLLLFNMNKIQKTDLDIHLGEEKLEIKKFLKYVDSKLKWEKHTKY